MDINNIFRSKISYKMKLIGMTLIAAFVGFITFYDSNMTFSKIGLLLGVVFSFIIYTIIVSRERKKDELQLDKIQYYEEDEFGLDPYDQSDRYDEDELV